MAQVVIWGRRALIDERRAALSTAIHSAVVTTLDYPAEKLFQRFVRLEPEDFLHPHDRGDEYVIVEISMFEGRTDNAKRALIAALFRNIEEQARIVPHSVEITITETPRVNWGIRGRNGADLDLDYSVDV